MAKERIDVKTVILGLQHTFVMFGATVLVPILTGLDIAVALFAAGVGTLIFHVVTKFKSASILRKFVCIYSRNNCSNCK